LPFNVHLLDVVFAAETDLHVRQSVLPSTAKTRPLPNSGERPFETV
jgi:hypothetical protein